MKNQKMSTTITLVISLVTTLCIFLLYIIANMSMTAMMKEAELENMQASLNAQANFIEEYIKHEEDLLVAFSMANVIREFLKDPADEQKKLLAQEYTEKYYAGLDNWEGLYVGEWNTHVITHSNPDIVGMVTRQDPEKRKELQDAILSGNRLYNAGIIVSPASQRLVLSMYCPVFDQDGKTILGYVGGGPFAGGLDALLNSVESQGAKYTMLNAGSGMYIFHENESLMATTIQDELLLSIISLIKSDTGNTSRLNGYKEYMDETDGRSISAYQYLPEYDWVVVSCNSEKNIYANANKNMRILGIICIAVDILISVLSWIMIKISTKPLKYVETSINQLKELKLQKGHKLDGYINHKSEIGQIATAIDSLYDSFKDIVFTLSDCSDSLTQSAMKMSDSSTVLIQCVAENSDATNRYAQRAEIITDTVGRVGNEISEVAEVLPSVETKIKMGSDYSSQLSAKMAQMKQAVNDSLQTTSLNIVENKKAIQEAMASFQSLDRIDEMMMQFMEIATQANLLSQNTSIEAERAGETSRDFAMDAGESGSLADKSSSVATDIQSICNETKENIKKIKACFDDIVVFLQNDVQTQCEDFIKTTNEYHHSINRIQTIIQEIDESAHIFVMAVAHIIQQIDDVQNIPYNTIVSKEDVMNKAAQIGKITEELSVIAKRNQDNAISIREIVGRFSVE